MYAGAQVCALGREFRRTVCNQTGHGAGPHACRSHVCAGMVWHGMRARLRVACKGKSGTERALRRHRVREVAHFVACTGRRLAVADRNYDEPQPRNVRCVVLASGAACGMPSVCCRRLDGRRRWAGSVGRCALRCMRQRCMDMDGWVRALCVARRPEHGMLHLPAAAASIGRLARAALSFASEIDRGGAVGARRRARFSLRIAAHVCFQSRQ